MNNLKFSILLALLLVFPAVLLAFGSGDINNVQINLKYFLPNYFYIAAPHLLVVGLAFWPKYRQPVLLCTLLSLNLLLVLFGLWIKFDVPPREAGLAWVLYIPLWMIALVVISLALWLIKRHRVKALAQAS